MKNKLRWLAVCCCLLMMQKTLLAQDPIAVCEANQRKAIQILSQETLSASDKAKVYNLVKPCADQGNIDAICNMGILYKDGIGVKQNFNKAFEYFETSALADHDKALYALGYFYMKGLGSIDQDYEKAVSFYEESIDPMATHWLGYLKYFGYGTPKEKEEALDYLFGNLIINSGELLEHFVAEMEPSTSGVTSQFTEAPKYLTDFIDYNTLSSGVSNRKIVPVPAVGKYKGHIIEYDWSGTNVWRYIPIDIIIDADQSVSNSSTVAVNVMRTDGDKDEIIFHGIWKNGVLLLRASLFELPRLYGDHPDDTTLKYSLNDIVFRPTPHNGVNYISGVFRGGIRDFKEPMNPMVMVIEPEVVDTVDPNPDVDESSIVISPNPFDDLLTINYELKEDAEIGISISSLDYSFYNILFTGSRTKGEQRFVSRVSWIPPGMYLLWFSVNGKLINKTVVKQ